MGIFYPFLTKEQTQLVGVEAGGGGGDAPDAATLCRGRPGVLHGSYSYLLQDDNGGVLPTESVSAGLDYPGVGPEHSHLKESGRASYVSVTDDEAMTAFDDLCRCEGIIPALESAHAIAHAQKMAAQMTSDKIVLACLSGRGDKDLQTVFDRKGWKA